MRYAVVTGVSKGLGESIAQLLMESGIHVTGISRYKNDKLNEVASANSVTYQHFSCDLSHMEETEKTFQQISEDIFSQEPDTVYLINNAGVLEPIDKSMNTQSADVAHHIQVNATSPIILTNLFLKKAAERDVRFISTMITSGAAERPVYGWSAYCSSKAGINMFTKTAALEQDELKTQNKVIAFSPGIMDTDMQEKIRQSDKDAFIEVDQFRGYKQNNQLKDPDTVGGILVDILTDETSVVNGKIYSVTDYL
ncbi:(S)-benzoin forming benzil reductase [Lentibacillus jeotgali]|uniref:(S)-benzoin forming benzil reductase n=1 Tax=Lentibacillus jeotgali TaxID=558169 RepID=UPI0002626BE5|nr:(S)-benzoin forming benzil reductase [Lentibacillus jeotgali]